MYRLKIFFRTLRRDKVVVMLSILDLAVAAAVFLLISIWAANEFSFDHFHKDYEQMYRVCRNFMLNNEEVKIAADYQPVGRTAKDRFPEIKAMCRVAVQKGQIGVEEKWYNNDFAIVDTSFFSFFSFPLKSGNSRTCLAKPDYLVIDESLARQYYPAENPIGKMLNIWGRTYTISAVMSDFPENSHLKVHMVIGNVDYMAADWGRNTMYVSYFKIPDPEQAKALGNKLLDMRKEYPGASGLVDYELQALKDIHFDSTVQFDTAVKGNRQLVMILFLTACGILLVACINFMNLFVSASFLRVRTLAVKKTYGADCLGLSKELYLETLYYIVLAVGIGVTIALLALPSFNELIGGNLKIDFDRPGLYFSILGLIAFMVLLTGSFPAWRLTRLNIVSTLKGHFSGGNIVSLQKKLVILQFIASIMVLIFSFFVHKQVDFMLEEDLGFDKENILWIKDADGWARNSTLLKSELHEETGIVGMTMKDCLPMEWLAGRAAILPGNKEGITMEECRVDPDYFKVMGMELKLGEGFSEGQQGEGATCVLNESALKLLGYTDPIDQVFTWKGQPCKILGIVKDAQVKVLSRKMDPQVYQIINEDWQKQYFLFKITGNPQQVIATLEKKWDRLNPGKPFEYHFLDDTYADLYETEINAGQMLWAALGIILFLSIAGLYAMAHYVTQRRFKEVGIRKVNGATIPNLLLLLNRSFFVWIGIAYALACPLAYYLVSRWLESYTKHTIISIWVFVWVGVITLFIILFTVSYQVWKAAHVNPIEILKSE